MSSLFSQTTPVTSGLVEAIVQSVDAKRFVCTIKTTKGQRFDNVTWLLEFGGYGRDSASYTPKMGDRVVASTGLGYPVILGCLPRIDRDPTTPVMIDSGSEIADTGKLTPLTGSSLNSSKPGDFLAGDKILASEGGGLVGVLRSGTVLLKASKLAQIILSKFDTGVKIVGRSIDLYSELGSEVYASVKGRVYKWVGFSRTPAEANAGLFRYQEFYGDTAAAEELKDNYELGSVGITPSTGGALRKILVVDANQVPLRIEEIDLEGNVTTTTRIADGSATNVVSYTKGRWQLTTTNGTYCDIKVTEAEILITHNGDASVKLNTNGVYVHKGASDIQVLQDSILMDSSGHFVRITPSGVAIG